MSAKKIVNKVMYKNKKDEIHNIKRGSKKNHKIRIAGRIAIGAVVVLTVFCVGREIWQLYHPETSAKIAWTRHNEIGTALQNAFGFKVTEESNDSSGNYVRLESETGLSLYYYYIPGYFDLPSQDWFQIQQGPKEQKYDNFGHILYEIHEDEINEIAKKNNGYSSAKKKSTEAPYHNEIRFVNYNDKEAFLSDLSSIRDIQLTEKACEETLKKDEDRNNFWRNGCFEMTPVMVGLEGEISHDIWK